MKVIYPNTNPYRSIFQISNTHNIAGNKSRNKIAKVFTGTQTQTSMAFTNRTGGCGCRK